jgi:Alkylmercury lyase
MSDELDTRVKLAIYGAIAETGAVPTSAEIASKLDLKEGEVRASFIRLQAKRLLVPEPGDPSRIRMAPPFSGIPTAFPVDAQGKRYYANCVWDAFGIAAALHADAVSPAADGYSGETLTLEVKNGRPIMRPYVAHFAVPTAHWWDDIVFT